MDSYSLTKIHKQYIEGKGVGEDICVSCRKPFAFHRQNHIEIGNSQELNEYLGEDDYLVPFFICNDCMIRRFRGNMEFAIEIYKLREQNKGLRK